MTSLEYFKSVLNENHFMDCNEVESKYNSYKDAELVNVCQYSGGGL